MWGGGHAQRPSARLPAWPIPLGHEPCGMSPPMRRVVGGTLACDLRPHTSLGVRPLSSLMACPLPNWGEHSGPILRSPCLGLHESAGWGVVSSSVRTDAGRGGEVSHTVRRRPNVGNAVPMPVIESSHTRASPSGKAMASQAIIRGFESRCPLHSSHHGSLWDPCFLRGAYERHDSGRVPSCPGGPATGN